MSITKWRLEELLAPTTASEFFEQKWEKAPWHTSRHRAGYYAGLFSRLDLDRVIAFTRPKFPDPAAFADTAKPPSTYIRGVLADQPGLGPSSQPGLAEVREAFDRGKTVVIMAMQHRWPAIAELCRNLEAVFHCPVHANTYLTPAKSQGFAAHHDPHEVFILQLEGQKIWRIYDRPEVLPLANTVSPPRLPSGTFQEVCLEPGDLLYIPRGFVHEASTQESYSLHLTVGINVYRWVDLLHFALEGAAQREVGLRESIPGGAQPRYELDLQHRFRELLQLLADDQQSKLLLSEGLRGLADQFFRELPLLPIAENRAPIEPARITPETLLEKENQAICRVIETETDVAIEFPGNRVAGPLRITAALHFIRTAQRFTPAEIPGELSTEAKLVLCRRLIREGLLTVSTEECSRRDGTPSFLNREANEESVKVNTKWNCEHAVQEGLPLSLTAVN